MRLSSTCSRGFRVKRTTAASTDHAKLAERYGACFTCYKPRTQHGIYGQSQRKINPTAAWQWDAWPRLMSSKPRLMQVKQPQGSQTSAFTFWLSDVERSGPVWGTVGLRFQTCFLPIGAGDPGVVGSPKVKDPSSEAKREGLVGAPCNLEGFVRNFRCKASELWDP